MGLLTLPQACVVPLLTPQLLQVAVPPSPPLPSAPPLQSAVQVRVAAFSPALSSLVVETATPVFHTGLSVVWPLGARAASSL